MKTNSYYLHTAMQTRQQFAHNWFSKNASSTLTRNNKSVI